MAPLFITRKMAAEGGMTHEGTIYGVPAWFKDIDNPVVLASVCKFYPLRYYVAMMNALAGATAQTFGVELRLPYSVKGKIE